MPRIDLTDDNLLRLNAVAFGAHGAWALADPKSYHVRPWCGPLLASIESRDQLATYISSTVLSNTAEETVHVRVYLQTCRPTWDACIRHTLLT